MKKIPALFFLLTTILSFNLYHSAQATHNNIIARINGQDVLEDNFNRLLNAQSKKFYTDLNFNLLRLPTSNPKATLKRESLIRKAKEEGITANANDFDNAWRDLTIRYGTIDNLEEKASRNNLKIADIREKVEENILLEKLLRKQIKEKLIEKIVNETLILQEAQIRNLNVPEEEITKKLDLIKEKQGGEEEFNQFLSRNNATLEDARNEIKNQILVQLIKNQINDLNTFLDTKKLNSDIVIYTNKIFPKESDTIVSLESTKPVEQEVLLRKNTYPTVNTGWKPVPAVKGIEELEQETNNILAEEIQKDEESTDSKENKIFLSDIKESTIIEPINIIGKSNKITKKGLRNWLGKIQDKTPQTENEMLVPGAPLATTNQETLAPKEKNTPTVSLPPSSVTIQNDIQNSLEDSSKTLKELRRRIEQRQFVNR